MAYPLSIEYIARLTLLIVCRKEFEFINVELCFKVKHAVKSWDDGCPLEGVVTGFEMIMRGPFGVLVLCCFWCYLHHVFNL